MAEQPANPTPSGPSAAIATDRNLLFALLAFQNNFINRQDLLAAFDGWTNNKSRLIADLLVQQQKLTAPQRQLIEALTAEHLKQHHNDPQQSLAALSSIESGRAALQELQDADLQQSLGHVRNVDVAGTLPLKPAGDLSDPTKQERDQTLDFSVGSKTMLGRRFRILRPHADGGLGRVSVARDEELNREVALKEILPKYANEASARARFTQEAEITGGLEHPGIVPVYGLGNYADGRPFYAMRFIRGDSLKSAIERHHRPRDGNQLPLGERVVELRQLLGRFIDVCHAIDFAHSKGVLHRDLKPGNIMLGKYGETLVVDWGLAKAQGMTDQLAELHSEMPLRPSSGSSIDPTEMGIMVGTLQYMSPEQATGRVDLLGRATDIFSLGATLYHLLTGQTPYHNVPREELTEHVKDASFKAPRLLKRDIPPALEAICLKAMAREPSKRYENGRDLIADLEHFLADEPVSAYPESALTKVFRLGRRYRTWVRAGMVAITLVAAIALVAGFMLEALRRKATQLAVEKTTLANTNASLAVRESNQRQKLAVVNSELTLQRDRAQQAKLQIEEQLDRFQRVYYSAQLQEVSTLWQTNSPRARELLYDLDRCPMHLRDFTWGMYAQLVSRGLHLCERSHTKGIRKAEYSPNGAVLASVDFDGQVKLWDVATAQELFTLDSGLSGYQQLLAFSPDGTRLAATEAKSTEIRQWDVAKGTPLATVSADGYKPVLRYGASSDILLWARGSRVVVRDIAVDQSWELIPATTPLPISSIALSLDGKKLAVGHGKHDPQEISRSAGYIVVWDLGAKSEIAGWNAHLGAISSIAFTADAQSVVSVGRDGDVKQWSASAGKEIATISRWHNDTIETSSLDNTATTAIIGARGAVQIVDISKRQEWKSQRGEQLNVAVAVAPNRKSWAVGAGDRIGIAKNLVMETAELRGHTGQVYGVSFSPDCQFLATSSSDSNKPWQVGEIKLWDLAKRKELATLGTQVAGFYCVAFSPDGNSVAAGTAVGEVKTWKVQNPAETQSWIGHLGWIRCIAYTPDGRTLATAGSDRVIKLWNVSDGKLVKSLTGHQGMVTSLAFSGNGEFLASTSADSQRRPLPGEVKLWDVSTGTEYADFRGHQDRAFGVAFAPDSKSFASVAFDESAILWDVSNKRQRAILGGNSKYAKTVAFSPDNRVLAVGSSELDPTGKRVASVKFWDPVIGLPRFTFPAHEGFINALAFSSNHALLATAGSDGTVKIWEATRYLPEETASLTSQR